MAAWGWVVTQKIGNGVRTKKHHELLSLIVRNKRLMTAKAPNRAAVHGTKLPVTETIINREEAEMEINKGKEEKEKKREEVGKIVDSQLNGSDKPNDCISIGRVRIDRPKARLLLSF